MWDLNWYVINDYIFVVVLFGGFVGVVIVGVVGFGKCFFDMYILLIWEYL